MNKQEAILKLEDESWEYENYFRTIHAVDLDDARKIISQIDEPEKVVVPKFVVDWIEDHKGYVSKWDEEARADFVFMAINDLFRLGEGLKPLDFTIDEKVSEWMTENTYKFITAILFGYEVEKEKLYTVEIPDPHGIYKIRYLFRNSEGNIRIGGSDCRDMLLNAETHLTESEIKQDFEWAWKWAKEVEV